MLERFFWLVPFVSLGVFVMAGASKKVLTPEETASIEEAVLAVNAKMNDASNALDVDRFFGWIVDGQEGCIIQDGRLFQSREEALTTVKRGYQGIDSLSRTFDRTHVTVLSSEIALLTAAGGTKVVLADGRVLEQPFALSLVFVLRDGEWMVAQGDGGPGTLLRAQSQAVALHRGLFWPVVVHSDSDPAR